MSAGWPLARAAELVKSQSLSLIHIYRNIKAKINRQGIWIEKLEHNPGKYIPEELRKAGEGEAVRVDLNRPMKEILAQLSQYLSLIHISDLRCTGRYRSGRSGT